MDAKESLKTLAKLQHNHICTIARAIVDGICSIEQLDEQIEKYVQTRIALALKSGEVTI